MLIISKTIRNDMIKYAKKCYPQEACGFLAGKDGKAARFIPLQNMERSSVSYAMDPKEQMRVFRDLNQEKLDLIGIFHSHVASPAAPSEKDKRLAFYPDVSYLIVSLSDMENPELKSFKIIEGAESPEEITVQ